MTHTELEAAYMALCKAVETDARHITGLCLSGRVDAAGEASAALVQRVRTTRLQHKMQQEVKSGYDLATLRVDAASASNSETGWERED
jgi:hypothetical protein